MRTRKAAAESNDENQSPNSSPNKLQQSGSTESDKSHPVKQCNLSLDDSDEDSSNAEIEHGKSKRQKKQKQQERPKKQKLLKSGRGGWCPRSHELFGECAGCQANDGEQCSKCPSLKECPGMGHNKQVARSYHPAERTAELEKETRDRTLLKQQRDKKRADDTADRFRN